MVQDLKQSAVKGAFWSILQSSSGEAISFIVFLVLARLLSPGNFGLIAYAGVFIALMQAFLEQGITGALVQRSSIEDAHFDSAFWAHLIISAFLALTLSLLALPIAFISKQPRLVYILPTLSITLPLNAMTSVPQAIYNRDLNFKPLAIRILVGTIGGGCVGITLAFLGAGVWSLVGQQLANSFLSLFTLFKTTHWRPRFRFSLQHLLDLKHYAFNITGSAFLDFFNRRSDDFLIGTFLGTTALGYYSVAYRLLLTLTRIIVIPFNSISFATFARLQNNQIELKKFFYLITFSISLISLPCFLGVLALAPELIPLFAGAKWQPSVLILQILMLAGLLHSIAFIHGSLMRATGKVHWNMRFTLGGALTNIILFFIVVRFGTVWVAAAYVLSAYLWLPVDLGIVKKILHHRTIAYLRQFLAPLTASLIMLIGLFLFRYFFRANLGALSFFLISAILGAVIYIGICCWFLSNKIKSILHFLKSMLIRKEALR